MKKLALLFPIIAGSCWGCCGVFVRVLTAAGLNSVTITIARAFVTIAVLAVGIGIYDKSLFRVSRRDLPVIALVGVMGFSLMNIFYNISINLLSMSLASVLLCTAPVFVILFGSVLFGEKITPVRVFCMVAALVGCVLLSGVVENKGLTWSIYGIGLGLASAICNAVYTMGVNEATDVRKVHPLTVNFYSILLGAIPILFFTDYGAIADYLSASRGTGFLVILGNALTASLIPNLLFTISFRFVDSGVVSILASGAEPTSAMIFGILAYAEIPTAFGLAGMIITIAALTILTLSDMRKGEEP